jgi:hypothetical protein
LDFTSPQRLWLLPSTNFPSTTFSSLSLALFKAIVLLFVLFSTPADYSNLFRVTMSEFDDNRGYDGVSTACSRTSGTLTLLDEGRGYEGADDGGRSPRADTRGGESRARSASPGRGDRYIFI